MTKDLTKIFIDEIDSSHHKMTFATNNRIIKSIDYTWSSDFLDMNDYGPENKRSFRFMLVVIDGFSKIG